MLIPSERASETVAPILQGSQRTEFLQHGRIEQHEEMHVVALVVNNFYSPVCIWPAAAVIPAPIAYI